MSDFTAAENKRFMDGLKRRAYMVAFPNEPVPATDQIVVEVLYNDNGCCGHDTVELLVYSKERIGGGTMGHAAVAEFLQEFFGVEDA